MRKKAWIAAAMAAAVIAGGCAGGNQKTAESQGGTEAQGAAETSAAASDQSPENTEQAEPEQQAEPSQESPEASDRDYLQVYFDVEIPEEGLDAANFSDDLKKVAGDQAPDVEGDLTALSAISAAVKAADYEELALSYPQDKVKERLAEHGISGEVEEGLAADLACALDVSLVTDEEGAAAAAGQAFTAQDAEALLMRVADANGDARNYLGMASDPDIYGKLDQAWNSFIIFDDSQLADIGRQAVQQQVTTGYGIKSAAYSARFLPELTLQYGHSDITHAHQLIGLLNSENIDAKVQLEPKISIYQYLLDWGPVPEATPTYEVKKFDDDLYLVYAVEYDLQLEFQTTEELKRFDSVIKEYAKKNEGNEEAVGLIYGSWWQPLYSTTRTDMPEADYHQIYDCVVTNGIYSIHPFTLPENMETTVEKLKEFAGDSSVEITPQERYVNTAFYNYLTGDDYQ